LNISHDKVSGALYMRLRDGEYDHTEDFSEVADVYLDVDRDGNVLGLEALSFEDLAQAIEEHGGKLDVPEVWSPKRHVDSDMLREALDSLEPRHREVLSLRFYKGFPTSEVADRLGITVAATHRLYIAAISELREALEERELGQMDESSLEALLSTL